MLNCKLSHNLVEHFVLLDRMMCIEDEASMGPSRRVSRPYRCAARRVRMNREFDPRYDAKIIQIIEEFQQTGTSTVAEEWKAKFPGLAEALTLCAVDGVGPKRALILCREGYR